MSIAAGITATKATLDVAKLLMDKLNVPDVDVHDVRSKVQEMLIHAVNAQTALGVAQIELAELRHRLDSQEAFKVVAEDMEYQKDGGFLCSEV